MNVKFLLFCLFCAGQLLASNSPQEASKYYEILGGSRTLVVSVVKTSSLSDIKLTSGELLKFFPEKNKASFAYENQQEIVAAVILAQQLFVYGKDWSDPKGFKFRFGGQWLDADGKTLGDAFPFKHPSPELNPRLKLVAQPKDRVKVSRKGGFGFICYDLTQQKPAEARFLKIRVMKGKVSQTPLADVVVSNFDLVLELPAVP